MDKFFSKLGDVLLDLPIAVVVVLIILAMIFYFFKNGITNWLKREVKAVKKVNKLEYHRFFNVCDDVERRIKNMYFVTDNERDETKTKIMHRLIELKCESMRNKFTALLKTDGIDDWGIYELNSKFKKTLSDVVSEYNQKCKLELMSWGIDERDADYIIQEYEDYRMTMVGGFIDSLDSVLSNSDYANNFDKINTVLELCALAIYVIPRDVRSVFEAVNGRFKKYNL